MDENLDKNTPIKDNDSLDGDDYVIISKEELDNLKKEIEELKKGYRGYTSVTLEELNDSILNLNHSIHMLLELFEGAAKEFKKQQEDQLEQSEITKLASKLDMLIEQNKAIAKGILYLVRSDKEEKEERKKEREEQRKLREALLKREQLTPANQLNAPLNSSINAPLNGPNGPINSPINTSSLHPPTSSRFNPPRNIAPSLINELNEFEEKNENSTKEVENQLSKAKKFSFLKLPHKK